MRRLDCAWESEVLSAVYTSRWPDRVSDELREHVFECRICADVLAVASAFETGSEDARAHARVPDASIVWWRAQLRSRQEAAREAIRPITVAQAIGLAAVVGIAGAIFGATATWFQQTLRAMWSAVAGAIPVPSLPSWSSLSLPDSVNAQLSAYGSILGWLILFVILASVAVYAAVRATESDA